MCKSDAPCRTTVSSSRSICIELSVVVGPLVTSPDDIEETPFYEQTFKHTINLTENHHEETSACANFATSSAVVIPLSTLILPSPRSVRIPDRTAACRIFVTVAR